MQRQVQLKTAGAADDAELASLTEGAREEAVKARRQRRSVPQRLRPAAAELNEARTAEEAAKGVARAEDAVKALEAMQPQIDDSRRPRRGARRREGVAVRRRRPGGRDGVEALWTRKSRRTAG